MISHIRIQNLRSLVDTGFIEIKPLTILLGSNSSGKSTFLRSFPLFTQSVSKSLREPISWFDDSLVDFGDYDTAISRLASGEDGIKFSYKLKSPITCESFYRRYHRSYYYNDLEIQHEIIEDSSIEISFAKDTEGTYVNSVTINKRDLTVLFLIQKRTENVSFFVNGKQVFEQTSFRWKYGPSLSLLPVFEAKRKIDEEKRFLVDEINSAIVNKILPHCSKRLKGIDKIQKLIDGWRSEKNEYLDYLRTQKILLSINKVALSWQIDDPLFLELYNLSALLNAVASFGIFDEEIKEMYLGCSYTAPMRAAANRYYRKQGLQVRNVDPYGKNLQEFIASLNDEKKKSYEEFTQKVLGLKISIENSAGHQSIILEGKNGKSNLTDVGFGYSQILPILTTLWLTNQNISSVDLDELWMEPINDILLMEQPELHLHPAMQARTADVLMLVVNEAEKIKSKITEASEKKRSRFFWNIPNLIRSSIIVETHSQAIINRIGKRIREKRFDADNVSILLFEKDNETGATKILPITYNEKGQLQGWPYGFFEPTDSEYDTLFDR